MESRSELGGVTEAERRVADATESAMRRIGDMQARLASVAQPIDTLSREVVADSPVSPDGCHHQFGAVTGIEGDATPTGSIRSDGQHDVPGAR